MFLRIINPLLSQSFFIFGARGTGKSTYLKQAFASPDHLYIDLLNQDLEDYYFKNPQKLYAEATSKKYPWIILDEIQKVPKLLDVAHQLIEEQNQKFIFTGSSARKLKRGTANLLAGRAFINFLFPFTVGEIHTKSSDLNDLLHWGSLPKIFSYNTTLEKHEYLKSYVYTYVQQEIKAEQLVRNIEAFRYFLPIAAQTNGCRINARKMSKQVGVDPKTIQTYYQVLEDTMIGFYVPGFHLSVRKSQRILPKFYLFDLGVKRQMDETILNQLIPRTSAYGDAFEHFIMVELFRLNEYLRKSWKFSYLEATMGGEVDLVLSRGNIQIALELKSTQQIDENEVRSLEKISKDIPNCKQIFYVSQDTHRMKMGNVECIPWYELLKEFETM